MHGNGMVVERGLLAACVNLQAFSRVLMTVVAAGFATMILLVVELSSLSKLSRV